MYAVSETTELITESKMITTLSQKSGGNLLLKMLDEYDVPGIQDLTYSQIYDFYTRNN